MQPHSSISLIGGGLVGALLGCLLARQGWRVDIYEKRPDQRRSGFEAGRSINLALARRGLHALGEAGMAETTLDHAVMMRGRMVHPLHGKTNLQRYGMDDREVIWSIERGRLNGLLLDAAEAAGARLHFGQSLQDVDFATGRIRLQDSQGHSGEADAGLLIGTDGAGSTLRQTMQARMPLGERVEYLGHGYKELEIPPAHAFAAGMTAKMSKDQRFMLEPHALHIWPRGGYMCIALPNVHGSFTVTLFLPNHDTTPSFDQLADSATAEAFFRNQFPDLLPLLPGFARDYAAHPVGLLATLYLDQWHLGGQAVLLGDAAHAIVPFHGQGMNCGFEDAVALAALLRDASDDPAAVFAEFQRQRQPNANAIAAMALENYTEMRDSVADPYYLARRALGQRLSERAPTHFMARYRLVTFTDVPYAYALERGRAQDAFVDTLLADGHDVDTVDIDAAVQRLKTQLPPLPESLHG